jgi:hypothetical protein
MCGGDGSFEWYVLNGHTRRRTHQVKGGFFSVAHPDSRKLHFWIDVRRVADRRGFPDVITTYIPRQKLAMAHYRIYVTTPDGHVTAPPTVVECDDDQEAIGKAAQMVDGQAIELWEGARFIMCFPRNPSS